MNYFSKRVVALEFNMQFTLKVLTSICFFLFFVALIEATYDVPDVTIEALQPKGLRVSLPDDSGVKFFEFHANKNEDIKEKELGNIFNRVSASNQGKWQFEDKTVELKKGDVLNYWVLVWNNGETYIKHGLSYTVEDLVD